MILGTRAASRRCGRVSLAFLPICNHRSDTCRLLCRIGLFPRALLREYLISVTPLGEWSPRATAEKAWFTPGYVPLQLRCVGGPWGEKKEQDVHMWFLDEYRLMRSGGRGQQSNGLRPKCNLGSILWPRFLISSVHGKTENITSQTYMYNIEAEE